MKRQGAQIVIVVGVLFLCAHVQAFAAAENWRAIGPPGGLVREVVIHPQRPNILYALGHSKVFKSENAGEFWQDVTPGGRADYSGLKLVISKTDPEEMYLMTSKGNILRSFDAGETWQPYFSQEGLRVFFVDAANPNYLLAYRQVNPSRATLVRSRDAGQTWEEIVKGIDLNVGAIRVYVNARAPNEMIAVQSITHGSDVVSGENIFKSVDNGDNWAPLDLDDTGVQSVIFDPRNNAIHYIKLYRGWRKSTDGGNFWFPIAQDLEDPGLALLVIHPENSLILYGVAHDESNRQSQPVYKSFDGGLSWFVAGRISPTISIQALAFNPQNTEQLFAAAHPFGVFRSDNAARNWQPKNAGLSMTTVYSLAVVSAETLLAAVENVGIRRTTDGGKNWQTVIKNTSTTPGKVMLNPEHPHMIYTNALPESLYATNPTWAETGGFAVSHDAGAAWNLLRAEHKGLWEFAVGRDNRTIYGSAILGDVAGLTIAGIIKSTDAGLSWHVLDLGVSSVNWLEKIQIDPEDPEIVYALLRLRGEVDTDRLIHSVDGGGHWQTLADNVDDFFVNTSDANYLYYSGSDSAGAAKAFFVSADRGRSWSKVEPIPDSAGFRDLVAHPEHAEILFAAQASQGVRFSTDHGATWRQIGERQQSLGIRRLRVTAQSDSIILFGSTWREGVKRFALAHNIVSSVVSHPAQISSFRLIGNYPNPFNARTVISYELSKTSSVSLKIYDMTGRQVRTLFSNRRQEPGKFEMIWNGSDHSGRQVASGLYLYELRAGGLRQARKMVLVR